MKKFILVLLILGCAQPVLAKRREPIPVYLDTPPHKRPYISTADKNRLYAERNPIRRVDPEVKKYLERLIKEENKIAEKDKG